MKFLSTIFVALTLLAVSEALMTFNESVKYCIDELKVAPADKELLVNKKFLEKDPKDLPRSLLCFPNCVYKGMGYIDEKNAYNLARIEEAYLMYVKGDKPRVAAMLEKCKDAAKGADECEKAFNKEVCFRQQIK